MASTYKPLLQNDYKDVKTLLYESIPLTGSIVSGVYQGSTYNDANIKNYGHGLFQSVYDYPYLSSSANAIFDLTVGYNTGSAFSSSIWTDNDKKVNIYLQMAHQLMGHDVNGNVLPFDQDGNIVAGGTKLTECFFVNFARLLYKDEIKKGSFTLSAYTGSAESAPNVPILGRKKGLVTIGDYTATGTYKTNSPVGEYGVLYKSTDHGVGIGLLFYQAGIAVISASLFNQGGAYVSSFYNALTGSQTKNLDCYLTSSTVTQLCDGFRYRLDNIAFNNTTELHSTVYFCRANHNEFNYSSNPTYVIGSKIRNKVNSQDIPSAYVTGIGLYSADNELLAVAKISEPVKKSADNELTFRVRLDY